MINLRYHVVSLVAVFLALGLGIVMGSTVIDRVTVDALNDNLEDVRRSVGAIREENRKLGDQIKQGQDFAVTTRDQLLRGRLRNAPVMIVAVAGIDKGPVDEVRRALVSAQATLEGTIWFTSKMRLTGDGDVRALATALDLGAVDRPEVVRRQALARIATAREAATAEASPFAALQSAGFITYEGPPTATSTVSLPLSLASLPLANTRYVVVSGAGAEVGDNLLAVPLVQAYAQASARVVAAESGVDTQGGRSVFVGLLRGDVVSARLSTVDNLESPMGQTAAVLALEDLGVPRFGHYGVGPGAQSILPAPSA